MTGFIFPKVTPEVTRVGHEFKNKAHYSNMKKKLDFFFTCDFRPDAQYFPGLKKRS